MSRILIVIGNRDRARDIFESLPSEVGKEVVGDPFTAVKKLWEESFDGLILEDDMGHRVSMSEQILRMKHVEGEPGHKIPRALVLTESTSDILSFLDSTRIVAEEIASYTKEALSWLL